MKTQRNFSQIDASRLIMLIRILQQSIYGDDTMYWFYMNYPTRKIRIHRADCRYCNNGNGIHQNVGQNNGQWHGSFKELEDTLEIAQKNNYQITKCKKCLNKI